MPLQNILPAALPAKNSVFSEVLELDGFNDAGEFISAADVDSYLSSLPSLNTINHAIAKRIPVFTQKHLVLIVSIRNHTYFGKKIQSLFLSFNYDSLFYNHLTRNKFEGVFYDKSSQSLGVDVQSAEALEWLKLNTKDYFQVVINLTTHQFYYSDNRPRLREPFKSLASKINPVTIWLNQLEDIIRQFVPSKYPTKKISIHNGDRFILMPENFFLVCYLDILLIKHESGNGIFNYIVIDVLNAENNKLYKGVKNKDITTSISRYMDACNYHKIKPYTVKESKGRA